MPLMFPPNGPRPKTSSEVEFTIYHTLRERLDPFHHTPDSANYVVFHGVRWFATSETGASVPYREMDFLIASREHGLLIVEAKSARVTPPGRSGARNTSSGNLGALRGAFDQAQSLKPELERFLWGAPLTSRYFLSYKIRHAVWFPSGPWPREEGEVKGVPNALVFDNADMDDPEQAILRAFAYYEQHDRAQTALDQGALDALIKTLDQDSLYMQSRLAPRVAGTEEKIRQLSEEQFRTLQALADIPRLAVPGVAGSGKTVLAFEKAFRLAREGKRVLLLCSNPELAAWLRNMRDQEARPENALLVVLSIGALCHWARERAGQPRAETNFDEAEATQQARALEQCERALRRTPQVLFDALLVDEAQDFDQPLWKPLLQLLRHPKDGLLYLFYDKAQREAGQNWQGPLGGDQAYYPLVANLRNTQAIFKLIMRFYSGRGGEMMFCRGEEGVPPVYMDPRHVSSQTGEDMEEAALRQALDHLIGGEGFAPHDILIITCRPQAESARSPGSRWYAKGRAPQVGKHQIARGAAVTPGSVAVSTIRSAKGLERRAVILTELDGVAEARNRKTLLYLAISRAQHQLVILGSEADLAAP